jgi:hypothetical protein
MQDFVNLNEMALKKSFQELSDRKEKYDDILISHNYNGFQYYGFFIDIAPEIVCSGGFAPEYDFQGNMLQNYMDLNNDLESIYFSLVPFENVGVAVFGWVESKESACLKFIKSLHQLYAKNEIGNALVRFIFDSFENTFFKPSWWTSLSEHEKNILQNRVLSGALEGRNHDCLVDDGLRTVGWGISSVFHNINIDN